MCLNMERKSIHLNFAFHMKHIQAWKVNKILITYTSLLAFLFFNVLVWLGEVNSFQFQDQNITATGVTNYTTPQEICTVVSIWECVNSSLKVTKVLLCWKFIINTLNPTIWRQFYCKRNISTLLENRAKGHVVVDTPYSYWVRLAFLLNWCNSLWENYWVESWRLISVHWSHCHVQEALWYGALSAIRSHWKIWDRPQQYLGCGTEMILGNNGSKVWQDYIPHTIHYIITPNLNLW